MPARVFASRFLFAALALAPIVTSSLACSPSAGDDTGTTDNHLTGANSAQRGIHFQSYVYVPTTASDADIQTAIARQVKTAIGALRQPEVSINDRDAQNNLDPSTWTRQTVTLVDPTNASAATSQLQRVTYPYNDVAVVTNSLQSSSAVAFTMLAGDYSSYATQLIQNCSDDTTTDEDSLWYHYTPTMSSCASLIEAELTAIQTETTALAGDATKVGPHEAKFPVNRTRPNTIVFTESAPTRARFSSTRSSASTPTRPIPTTFWDKRRSTFCARC
jgi:hypothetical protein